LSPFCPTLLTCFYHLHPRSLTRLA